MKESYRPRFRLVSTGLAVIIAGFAMVERANAEGAILQTPQSTKSSTVSNVGIGYSIDIGSAIKTLSRLFQGDRYEAPITDQRPKFEARQLIAAYPLAAQQEAQAILAAAGAERQVTHTLPQLETIVTVLFFSDEATTDQRLNALQHAASAVAEMVVDRQAIAYSMQDNAKPLPGKQYAVEMIGMDQVIVQDMRLSGKVVIGLVDTELTNQSQLSVAEYKSRRIFPDSEKAAPPLHGNAVATILAGTGHRFEGVAQGVNLRVAGVMREVAPGLAATNTLLFAQAMDWLVGEKTNLVNLSLGAAHDAVLERVILKSQQKGLILIAAAGNAGPTAPPVYPAAYRGVIAVTAVDANKHIYSRANHGEYITIAAPGVDVWVPMVGDKLSARYMTGTSFATPFVTGLIARHLEQSGDADVAKQKQYLCDHAVSLGDQKQVFGCGLLHVPNE